MENLDEKIKHNGCGRCCEAKYLLKKFCEWKYLEEYIFDKIEERSKEEFVHERPEHHMLTFKKYGAKDCTNYECHTPYVMRALLEEEKINYDTFAQIKEMNDHKYYMGQKLSREIREDEWNAVALDFINNGFAEKFRKEHPYPNPCTKH